MHSSGFHLNVCLLPEPFSDRQSFQALVRKEIGILRSCILYADHLTVNSLCLQAVESFQRLIKQPRFESEYKNCLRAIPRLSAIIVDQNEARRIEGECSKALAKPTLSRSDKRKIDSLLVAFRPIAKSLIGETNASDLIIARKNGLIAFHESPLTGDFEQRTDIFLSHVLNALGDAKSFPYLNDQLLDALFRNAAPNSIVTDDLESRLQHSAVALDFMGRLPNLSCVPLKKIVQLKKKLAGPLIRFRGGVQKISASMESRLLGQDITVELNEIYEFTVRPAVEEIRSGLEQEGLMKSMWQGTAVNPPFLSKVAYPGVAFGAITLPEEALIAGLSAVTGLTSGVITGLIDHQKSVNRWNAKDMYFYFRASNL